MKLQDELAPICIFTYNRLSETKLTVEALKKNGLAKESMLYIFSDGPKNFASIDKVKDVRNYINNITGFKKISIVKSEGNMGLANSIINGVSEVIKKHGRVIVLEDDLITSKNFLSFMNNALDIFKAKEDIFSLSGYTMDLPSLKFINRDYYVGYRSSSWGWATWMDRWEQIDWDCNDYKKHIFSPINYLKFTRGGSDLPFMLWKQMNSKIDSWAIRWCFHQYKNDLYTIYPSKSKVMNIGFGVNATHTKHSKRFDTTLDDGSKIAFHFNEGLSFDKKITREFKEKYSIINRLKDKIKK